MLTDIDVYNRLQRAIEALGNEGAETVHGNTALDAARLALTAYQVALLANMEKWEPT